MSEDKLGLIGKKLAEVAQILDPNGPYSYRIVERDGVPYVCTRDVDTHRINLRMAAGVVVSYDFG